ncbi:MAG TPA: translation initiation factor IF-2 [Actinobacteria bacterium]|nr:translation initiation factor IF-2 [Actinomycetota bacterium]
MVSVRIYEIAKENNISSRELIELCCSIGIEVKSHSSAISDEQIIKVKKALEEKSIKAGKPDQDVKKTESLTDKKKPAVKDLKKSSKATEEKTEQPKREKSKASAKKVQTVKQKEDSKDLPEDDFESKTKPVSKWEEEKKINIRNVLLKELDKEDQITRFRVKPKSSKEKISKTTAKQKGLSAEKKTEKETDGTKKRPEIKKIIEIPAGISLKQLSEKISVPSNEIIKTLFSLGEVVNINQSLSNDMIDILSEEYNFKFSIIGFEENLEELFKDSPDDLVPRPPIVTVMGHVDHGKTTLLDSIRKSDVAENEAGGITQHIGAYQIEYKERKITFIDTPGHEAFTSMRARGTKVTDIAVIVVAANDGIMPQTVEAINHAKAANVPIIIAINKIDLPDADPAKIKKNLTEHNLVPEEWGGDTICVEISAKSKININELLDMILLVADVNEIKGNPDAEGFGIIIESRLDKGLGPVGSIIIKRGSIDIGDFFIAGNSCGRVRALQDDKGNKLSKALLSQPVEILGFSSTPEAGDQFFVVKNEKVAKNILSKKAYAENLSKISENRRHISLEEFSEIAKSADIKKLEIILKADVNGSIDAVEQSLKKIEDEKIKINILHKGVGAIADSDIILAAASDAIVIGFGVVPTAKAKEIAKKENVDIRTYNIIYKLIDELILAFRGMLEPETEEYEKGRIEVRELFKMPKIGSIAGCYVLEGEAERNNQVRVVRDGKIVHEGKIASIRRFKEDVKKVSAGYECGIKIENFHDINKGDILEIFEIREIKNVSA